MIHPAIAAPLACTLAVTARTPGLADRFHDDKYITYVDLLTSAAVTAPVFARAVGRPIGDTIFDAVAATRAAVGKNTNLGTVLLLAPLAAIGSLAELPAALAGTTVHDARRTFAAIRLAAPGGLGTADDHDVADEPTWPLTAIMRLAADRDAVARQYATDFADVFRVADWFAGTADLSAAVTEAYWRLLAEAADTQIARKFGPAVAAEVVRRAANDDRDEVDRWLRHHGYAPGATADVVTAALFVGLRAGTIPLPPPWPPVRTAS